MKCPKCKCVSGDNWTQCAGACPMVSSPYYDSGLESFYNRMTNPSKPISWPARFKFKDELDD